CRSRGVGGGCQSLGPARATQDLLRWWSTGAPLSGGTTMNRRLFLTLTGFAAVASALDALPVAAQTTRDGPVSERPRVLAPTTTVTSSRRLAFPTPGLYQITGQVRLVDPVVEISGIADAQRISRSDPSGTGSSVVSFRTVEQFDRLGLTPE